MISCSPLPRIDMYSVLRSLSVCMCGCVCVYVCFYVHIRHVHGVFMLCGKLQLIAYLLWAASDSWSVQNMVITSPPLIHITRGTHPLLDGKSDSTTERPIHTFTGDCVSPRGITGSYRGDIVLAPLQPLGWCEHLTAVIYDLTLLYCPVFFLSATLKTSAELHVAQHCSLFLVCLAI